MAQTVKCLTTMQETRRFNPWEGKIPWRRKWQLTPVLLPGKSHGRRILIGYSPWGCKELDMTERLHSFFPSAHSGPWLTEALSDLDLEVGEAQVPPGVEREKD